MKRFACLMLCLVPFVGGCLPTDAIPSGIQTALDDLRMAVHAAIENCVS